MTFLDKLKARVEATKKVITEFDVEIVSDDIRDNRLAICDSCEFIYRPTMQCRKCGCFLKLKTTFSVFKCPIEKW